MDEVNRFAPPATAVADVAVAGEVQPIRFWPPNGRIGRLRFFTYGLALYAAFVVASFVFGFVAALLANDSLMMFVVALIGFAVYLFAEFVLIVQRSHDMNLSGWWGIAALVPLVGIVWVLKAGTRGPNRWGPPPPPNGVAIRVLGWVLPALVVIGIVAAIALPAYQEAATRGSVGTTR